jgi:GlpG protein
MRTIGTLPDSNSAAVFSDFLVAERIENQMERERDGSFTVWINDEEQLERAKAFLSEYLRFPGDEKFAQAGRAAERARRAEQEELEAYRRRIKTAKGLFPRVGNYGVGVLSYVLIFICITVAVYSGLGEKREFTRQLFIDDGLGREFLGNVRHGEFWRLLTPIFLHFGFLHILFNLSWVYFLGCMIEARCGTGKLAFLVVVIGVGSNLAQYVSGTWSFGGMSGVVYGLTGYVWFRGKYDPASGLHIDPRALTMSIVWLVACFTGLLGPVANGTHVAGLILGGLFGAVDAWRQNRSPR